jgi:hypothetical protein
LNLKTAFNTENTEKNTENTESWLETPTHPTGELKLYLCALRVSVFSVLKELVTEFSRLKQPVIRVPAGFHVEPSVQEGLN